MIIRPIQRHKVYFFIGLFSFFLLIGGIIFVRWLTYSRYYESTNDAYVTGNQLIINAQLAGTVTQIDTDNTFFVTKGQELITIDSTDAQISLNLAKEKLANACRKVVDLFEQVNEREANVQAKKTRLFQSSRDYEHRQKLLPLGGVSLEDFQQAEAAYLEDFSLLQLAQSQLDASQAQILHTTVISHPQVREAIESLKDSYVRLKRCKIVSPENGLVAQRSVQIGQWVSTSTPLLAIIPLSQMWVDANFREVQLSQMRIGQKVTLHSDIYGKNVEYTGTVIGISGGTGSVFSILPPQNATGNWVKIIQRLPVRIALDPKQLQEYPLRLGLSMTVSVDLRNQKGRLIPDPSQSITLYQTDVFGNQENGVDVLIEEIFSQNIPKNLQSICSFP
jgi:membrane fusion protein (multidrug efflux system)